MEEYVSRDGRVGTIKFERGEDDNVVLCHETILKIPGF